MSQAVTRKSVAIYYIFCKVGFRLIDARRAFPRFSQSRIARFAGDYCSLAKRDEVKAFFEPRVKTIAGGARSLAQTLETIELCVAKAEFHGPKLTEFLGR